MKSKVKSTSFRLSDDIAQLLKDESKNRKTSQTQIVEECIRGWLGRSEEVQEGLSEDDKEANAVQSAVHDMSLNSKDKVLELTLKELVLAVQNLTSSIERNDVPRFVPHHAVQNAVQKSAGATKGKDVFEWRGRVGDKFFHLDPVLSVIDKEERDKLLSRVRAVMSKAKQHKTKTFDEAMSDYIERVFETYSVKKPIASA